MTAQEMIARFTELYDVMRNSKDVADMQTFGNAFTQLYVRVAEQNPELAEQTLNLLFAVEFYNFASTAEASAVAAKFINADKLTTGAAEESKGPHWRMDDMKAFLQSRNIPVEEKPYYNWPALWLTVNMVYSDYADTLVDLLGTKDNEKLATACYKMAIRKLKDPDRPRFLRDYFHL